MVNIWIYIYILMILNNRVYQWSFWLVVSTYPSKNGVKVSWDDEIPIWKVGQFHGSKPPTSYITAINWDVICTFQVMAVRYLHYTSLHPHYCQVVPGISHWIPIKFRGILHPHYPHWTIVIGVTRVISTKNHSYYHSYWSYLHQLRL